ncbi:hypothetical protein C3K47_07870 [Solitalea longa]|uniref:PPM-type phosphatase domain-containing protein n=1 Tax=Solitalea longa TaxID=2079460 RepID=A0A2S5A3V8_9SPHI|nr:PP2C family serine/threonine-protein phosphatase [Solitalea longa]POY37204.1 hypothetical protein C3K47_07870 [Solitalea longa]
MSEEIIYIKNLFANRGIILNNKLEHLFDAFVKDEFNIKAVQQILENQKMLTEKWKLKNRISDILQQPVSIPNGTVNKPYEAKLDFIKLGWNEIVFFELFGLDDLGLIYEPLEEVISGIPLKNGDLKFVLKFRVEGELEDSELHEKTISFVVNPDPKSLWKDIKSDESDPYWKEDNITSSGKLGEKNIVVASKRGRSHANVGSFRDDHFTFKHLDNTGWSIIALADGAGSSKISRDGSKTACDGIINYFSENLSTEIFKEFDILLKDHCVGSGENTLKKLNHFVYNNLGKAALDIHKSLEQRANKLEVNLKDLHTTLIFVLLKKYEFGYAILSFGVGDCPIGLINKDLSSVNLMNWLDVGEFGGGTRFITMPEIFQSEKFATRFGFKIVEDFSYLMLMTDGIYDPKFVVEANLDKIEKWLEFLEDLNGKNEDNIKVDFIKDNTEIETQLSKWMDFWSPGNHDDRTLAVIF